MPSWHRIGWGQEGRSPTPLPWSISLPTSQPDPTLLVPPLEEGQPTDLEPFETLVQGTQKQDGLFTLYRNSNTGKVYLELAPAQVNQTFLGIMTLESGVGEVGLYRGMPVNYFPFEFRRINNTVQIAVPNVYFRTDPGDPQWRSVERSFSDSILYSLPIKSIHPERQSLLIDLDDLLLGGRDLSDLVSRISWSVGQGYGLNPETSYLGEIKTFPLNVEIETHYGFTSIPGSEAFSYFLESLPDSRAFNLTIRYSFSQLPSDNGYQPRLADDRVGYFVTAYQDFSNPSSRDLFVRYINRWHIEPQDPTLPLSPPKEPLVFWIENTVPLKYREAVREGILLWNTAFEQAGIKDAIEVRQMPDDATWDPADVRYNVVRWTNTFRAGFFGIGPSRVNPLTGQILDADILIDGNATRAMEEEAGFLSQNTHDSPRSLATLPLCSHGLQAWYRHWLALQRGADISPNQGSMSQQFSPFFPEEQEQCFGMESARQMSMGLLSLGMVQNVLPSSEEVQTYIQQFLRCLIAHEIGHTLGLRHNFRGSTMLDVADLNNPEITHRRGLSGSVMDYHPVNLAPQGVEQGDYFPTILGPYDRWAIEYGYNPIGATTPQGEIRELERIAQRASEPGLSYATDEDAMDSLDPAANLWDLSGDSLQYAQIQMDNAKGIWERLERRYPLPGESYSELRDRFNTVFYHYLSSAMTIPRYVGGRVFNRDRQGDPGGRLPFEPIPIEQQRQALAILNQYVFAAEALQLSPDLINQLAPSRWYHWGSFPEIFALDYPVYDNLSFLQNFVLAELLSSDRLARLRDAELRSSPDVTLTIPELFDTLQTGIWSEVMQREEITSIASLRRGIQRSYVEILIGMVLRRSLDPSAFGSFREYLVAALTADPPEDARAIARYQLAQLQGAIASTLRRHRNDMDTATQAHLEDVGDRITRALEAQFRSG